MKKLLFILIASCIGLIGCINNGENKGEGNTTIVTPSLPYGAFLGRDNNNTKDFEKYEYLSFDFEEYEESTIRKLESNGNHCMGYLNVGSIENYRDYYQRFESSTFADYENWKDERWIDVSNPSWQTFVINTLAKNIKNKGGYGVYMDNVDVYSICKEHPSMKNRLSEIAEGLKKIIKGVNELGLKVMVNGGAEFFEEQNGVITDIWAYHQEEVFTLIVNYDADVFTTQTEDDKQYYLEIAKKMKDAGKEVFFLEYTKHEGVTRQIESYCKLANYKYYVSTTVGLY